MEDLITGSVQFSSAFAKPLVLEGRLDTRPYLHSIFLSLNSSDNSWGNSRTEFLVIIIYRHFILS